MNRNKKRIVMGCFVATGADHRTLGVPGEDELTGMGVS